MLLDIVCHPQHTVPVKHQNLFLWHQFEELGTVLTEVESTLNNRLLTYLYGDNEGPFHVVTPADLIYGHRIASTYNNQ